MRVIEDVHHHHHHHEKKNRKKGESNSRDPQYSLCVCVQNKEEEEAMCAQRSAKVGNTFSSSFSSHGE